MQNFDERLVVNLALDSDIRLYSSHVLLSVDDYVPANAGDDDVMTKNVTSEDSSMIQRLSERHVAVIIATTSALTLVMFIIAAIIFLRHRRRECMLLKCRFLCPHVSF